MDRDQRLGFRGDLGALHGGFVKIVFALLLLAPSLSWAAAPYVCFTGRQVAEGEAQILEAAWSCETMEHIGTGLKATSLVLSGTGFGLACTGIGLPATVWLQGASIGTSVLGLVIGQLPCDNRTKDSEIRAMAEAVVCEELGRQGIRCSLR